jgi:hypothetical protein
MAENTEQKDSFIQNNIDGFVKLGTLRDIVSVPVEAMFAAQSTANNDYLNYINRVMMDEKGMAKTITFQYGAVTGADGGIVYKSFTVPVMAVITHPNIGVATTKVDFSIEVHENVSDTSDTKTDESKVNSSSDFTTGETFSRKFSLSRSENRKRSTEAAATMKFEATLDRLAVPEALQKIIDAMLA